MAIHQLERRHFLIATLPLMTLRVIDDRNLLGKVDLLFLRLRLAHVFLADSGGLERHADGRLQRRAFAMHIVLSGQAGP